MKTLLTGVSSFTGYWSARCLSEAGHEVYATFQGPADSYEGIRGRRVELALKYCTPIYNCAVGSARFFEVIRSESHWDALCHHAADVTDYHSEDFDICSALANNTYQLKMVLRELSERGCTRMLVTGSIFEPGEGAGSNGLPAFSPYGISKSLTATVSQYYANQSNLHFGKFVIPNPFGPFEEPKFTAHLVRTWRRGERPEVRTPAYIRDNIHVSLLARTYVKFLENLPNTRGSSVIHPSGYIESQGQFAERFATEFRQRSDFACALRFADQVQFPEPKIRVNVDSATEIVTDWSEEDAWNELIDFYQHGD